MRRHPLNSKHLLARDRKVFALASEHRIPLAWAPVGGYTQGVRKVVQVHLNTFEAWRDAYNQSEERTGGSATGLRRNGDKPETGEKKRDHGAQ